MESSVVYRKAFDRATNSVEIMPLTVRHTAEGWVFAERNDENGNKFKYEIKQTDVNNPRLV